MTDQAETTAAEAAPEVDQTPAAATPETPPAPDLGAQIEALQAELAAMREAKQAVEADSEAARLASLSDAEKLEAERQAWREEVDAERSRLRLDLRTAALDKAGVLGKYHEFCPDVDVRTTDGQKALETWIGEHPETVKHAEVVPAPSPTTAIAAKSSKLAEILTGKRKSTLVTQKSLSEMFGSH